MNLNLAPASNSLASASQESNAVSTRVASWAAEFNRRLTPVMFVATLVFLASAHELIASMVGDDLFLIRRSPAGIQVLFNGENVAHRISTFPRQPSFWVCGAVMLTFFLEWTVYAVGAPHRASHNLWPVLFPPARITRRDLSTGRLLWFPRLGWILPDTQCVERVSKVITRVMTAAIFILVLSCSVQLWRQVPLLQLPQHPAYQWSMMVIWSAAVFECCLFWSVIGVRVLGPGYRTTLMLVLSPLLSAVTVLLARRVLRCILQFDFVHQVIWNPGRRAARLQARIADLEFELELLQHRIDVEQNKLSRAPQRGC